MSDLSFKNNEFNNYKHKISGTVFTHPYGEKNSSRMSQKCMDLTRLKQIFYKIHVGSRQVGLKKLYRHLT